MNRVEVDEIPIGFVRSGSGPPLLLLHGGMSTHREWRHQVVALAHRFDVIAWDAPGGGASGDPREDWDLGDFARCVLGLADALGVAHAHVAGLSFGGALALEVLRQRPAFVDSLALLSAYAGWRGSLPAVEVAARLAAVTGPQRPTSLEDARAFVGDDPSRELLAEVAGLERDVRPAAAAVAARALADADLRDVMTSVEAPTLVLHGGSDRRCPLSVGEALHAGISGSRLVVLEGVGHCMNLEAPEAVTRELLAHASR